VIAKLGRLFLPPPLRGRRHKIPAKVFVLLDTFCLLGFATYGIHKAMREIICFKQARKEFETFPAGAREERIKEMSDE
jgi:hypothetical protein